MAAPTPSRIKLQIDTLALPGYSRGEGQRLAAALQGELQRLLGQQAPAAGWQQQGLRLPALSVRAGERPELTGRRLARAIVRGLQEAP